MSYFKKHKEGFIITTVYHAVILLLLIFFGFFTPMPLPQEKGVLVDFGDSETGIGKQEPAPKPDPRPQQQEQTQEQVTPPSPPDPVQPSVIEKQPDESGEEVMTQDFEKTAAIDEGKKKKEEEKARKKREEEERKRKELEEQRRKEELERQKEQDEMRRRLADAERRRQDSLRKIEEARLAEQRRIAEKRRQDSIKHAEEQARIAAINSRAENVFGKSVGQNENSSASSGQGVTYEGGNQGTSTGTAGAERYGHGGGEGISFDLTGRSAVDVKKPTYPGQEEGVVVVRITVDKYGRVTKAEPGVRGSTSIDSGLLNAAKNAAMSTRFNQDNEAPAFQTGTITYRFVLD